MAKHGGKLREGRTPYFRLVVVVALVPEPVLNHKEGKIITEIESLISGLLEKAVARATITNQYTKKPVDISWFRGNLQLHWTRHLPDANTTPAWWVFSGALGRVRSIIR